MTPELYRDGNQPVRRRRPQPIIGCAFVVGAIDESKITVIPAAPLAEAAPAKSDILADVQADFVPNPALILFGLIAPRAIKVVADPPRR
jgi:hypothetical protein